MFVCTKVMHLITEKSRRHLAVDNFDMSALPRLSDLQQAQMTRGILAIHWDARNDNPVAHTKPVALPFERIYPSFFWGNFRVDACVS